MNILLIETESAGHHVALYLNKIIKNLLSIKKFKNITIVTTKSIKENKNYKFLNNSKINICVISDLPKPKRYNLFNLFIYQIRYYLNIKLIFKKLNKQGKVFDVIYVNTLDHFDKALSLFGSPFGDVKFCGFLNHIKFHHYYFGFQRKSILNLVEKFFFLKLLKIEKLKKIFVTNDFIKKYLKKKIIDETKIIKVNEAIDIKKTKLLSNQIFNFKKKYHLSKKENFFILVYGAIRKDKGIDCLIKSISKKNYKKKIIIIIAGIFDYLIAEDLKSLQSNCRKCNFKIICLNQYIGLDLQNVLFAISDVVWLGYKKFFGSSGVYNLASIMKRPVLVNNTGVFKNINKKYKIGYNINILNSSDISKKIEILMNKKNKPFNFKKLNKIIIGSPFSKKIVENL